MDFFSLYFSVAEQQQKLRRAYFRRRTNFREVLIFLTLRYYYPVFEALKTCFGQRFVRFHICLPWGDNKLTFSAVMQRTQMFLAEGYWRRYTLVHDPPVQWGYTRGLYTRHLFNGDYTRSSRPIGGNKFLPRQVAWWQNFGPGKSGPAKLGPEKLGPRKIGYRKARTRKIRSRKYRSRQNSVRGKFDPGKFSPNPKRIQENKCGVYTITTMTGHPSDRTLIGREKRGGA